MCQSRQPERRCSAGLKQENGPRSAQEMHQGLLLLQSHRSRRACYWSCPFCPGCRVGSMKEYLEHIETSHEEVQSNKDGPIMCIICNAEVRAPRLALHLVKSTGKDPCHQSTLTQRRSLPAGILAYVDHHGCHPRNQGNYLLCIHRTVCSLTCSCYMAGGLQERSHGEVGSSG